MINSLPQSLVDTAKHILSEAVALKGHIAMAKKASNSSKIGGLTAAERISKDVIPLGKDTATIPLVKNTATPHPDVESYLDNNGYAVHDYIKGLALKKGETKNPISIGKVLSRSNAPQHIKTAFEKDPSRQGISSDAKIVISRNPTHVAGMSTHQNWESCQTLGGAGKDCDGVTLPKQSIGEESKYIPHEIAAGSHIAYLVHHESDVDKHYAPIARVVLKPYKSASGHTILRPTENKEYGDAWNGFSSSVNDWANKHFPAKDPIYHIDPNVYPEGKQIIRNYAPEHNDFWKSQDGIPMQEHPNKEVIDHYLNNLSGVGDHITLGKIAGNPHLNEHHVSVLLNHPDTTPHSIRNLVSKNETPTAINYGLAHHELHPYVANNKGLNPSHIDHLINANKEIIRTGEGDGNFIAASLAARPNLTHDQADYLLVNSRAYDYPDFVGNAISKASHGIAKQTIDKIQENKKNVEYYGGAFGHIAKHAPELLPHLNNGALFRAYNHTNNQRSGLSDRIESEMLSRGPQFHKIVATRTYNPDTLHHIASIGDDDAKKAVNWRMHQLSVI